MTAPNLNAVGKPFGANYNSNYKIRKGALTSIKRLYAPYGPGMFERDQSAIDGGRRRKRRRKPRPAPLLEQPQMARDLPLSPFMQDLLRRRHVRRCDRAADGGAGGTSDREGYARAQGCCLQASVSQERTMSNEIDKQRQEFKRRLTAGFQVLRFEYDYFAAQCFQCCMTCGCAAVPDKYAERYVFYHEQDAQDLDEATTREKLGVYLAWAGDAEKIRKVFENAGCTVVHDGNTNGAFGPARGLKTDHRNGALDLRIACAC
jgi:hypothetical protein